MGPGQRSQTRPPGVRPAPWAAPSSASLVGSALVPRSPGHSLPIPLPSPRPQVGLPYRCRRAQLHHCQQVFSQSSTETPEGSSSRAEPGPECSPAAESPCCERELHPMARPPGPLTGQRICHNQNGFPLQMRLFLKTAIAARGRGRLSLPNGFWELPVPLVPYGRVCWAPADFQSLTSPSCQPRGEIPQGFSLSFSRSLFLFL